MRKNFSLTLSVLILFLCATVQGQDSSGYKVEILSAQSLKAGKTKNHQKLVGKVILRQGDVKLFCDSAEINQVNNNFEAWGKVFINKSDSIKAWGDSLKYFGAEEKARLTGNARLRKDGTELRTRELFLDDKRNLFYYLNPAVINTKESVITSHKGYFHTKSEKITFKDSVKIVHPDYTIKADTLDYFSSSENVVFRGPTNIFFKKEKIYCERGFYNSSNKEAEFRQNAVIESEENTMYADSIVVDEKQELSLAYYNVLLIDTANKINIEGHFGFFDQKTNSSYVSDSALFTQFMKDDTLYIHGDTIRAVQDSSEQKSFYVYHGVRMFKNDMQAVCDSLSYSFQDSLIRLFEMPIVWNGPNQLTGDTISVLSYDNTLHKMYINGKSMIISETDSVYDFYDQIKGRNMIGYFVDGKMDHIDVLGNGQTLYYAKENDSSYTGVNAAECSNIKIRFKDNEIHKITFLAKPEAIFYPLKELPKGKSKLENFNWFNRFRPENKEGVMEETEVE